MSQLVVGGTPVLEVAADSLAVAAQPYAVLGLQRTIAGARRAVQPIGDKAGRKPERENGAAVGIARGRTDQISE